MAETDSGDGQATEAVTQANVKVVGESPAQATAQLYQVMAQAAGLEALNAVANQQQMNSLNVVTTAQAVNSILSAGSSATARESQEILSNSAISQLTTAMKEILVELRELQEQLKKQK